jgi:hypothetical protein
VSEADGEMLTLMIQRYGKIGASVLDLLQPIFALTENHRKHFFFEGVGAPRRHLSGLPHGQQRPKTQTWTMHI